MWIGRAITDAAARLRGHWAVRAAMLSVIALAVAGVQRPVHGQQGKDDPLVARVNKHEIRLSDVYASIESLSLGDQIDARDQIGTYIEAIINEEVLFQWALRTGFAGDPALRKEVKDLVVRKIIENRVRNRIRVTPADAKAYYDRYPDLVRGLHVRVRSILRPVRAECERLMAEIDSEEAFIAAVRQHSLDEATREQGGDSGLIMRAEDSSGSYELRFFDMKLDEMRIFDVPEGCLLVRVVEYIDPPLPPFGPVQEQITQYLRNRQEVDLVDRLFRQAAIFSEVQRFYREAPPVAGVPGEAAAGAAGGTSQ